MTRLWGRSPTDPRGLEVTSILHDEPSEAHLVPYLYCLLCSWRLALRNADLVSRRSTIFFNLDLANSFVQDLELVGPIVELCFCIRFIIILSYCSIMIVRSDLGLFFSTFFRTKSSSSTAGPLLLRSHAYLQQQLFFLIFYFFVVSCTYINIYMYIYQVCIY